MDPRRDVRSAVCQEWILAPFGSEKVAAHIATALGSTDVYAFAVVPEVAAELFPERAVTSSRVGKTGFAQRHWRWLVPLMAMWWRRLDLARFDVVVTSSHATVNSIRVGRGTTHVSYCLTPMRYAWLWREERDRAPRLLRPLWPVIAALLRRSDLRRSRNVDAFIADSTEVQQRISTFYGRPSVVIYPPVDTEFYRPDRSVPREPFFLCAGRLVPYKRVDLAVAAATRAGLRLVVAGDGPELDRLRRRADAEVTFVGAPSDVELRDLYRRARALVFPGLEDFGIVPVEAQACGTPVLAYRAGGVLDTVVDGKTGVLFDRQDVEVLADAMHAFDPQAFDPELIREHAERFAADRFEREIREVVEQVRAQPHAGR